ncbi:ATP-dependent DNA helicase II subunit [Lachnellula occidentalis]|uniref:ATP-dependent DNA helicase II subunit 2 n=1 Tax=Lachnellula occidentalis TaxID=215460 RepID=A0A8H8U353_9HELO|nr:ATP-dependent DNA helicase II subunit [Lachnellula occidentalis]
MADKEANIYIVDVGSSTAECHNGRMESDLDYGMKYVWEKIGLALQASRKGLGLGVIALRHDETRNDLENGEGYENIAVLKDLGPIEMGHLKDLQKKIVPSSTDSGDAISAMILAVHMIDNFTRLKTGKLGKYKRKIFLVTDGQGPMDGNDLDSLATKVNELEIELVVVGIDFDDLEYGFKEEDKPSHKRSNEKILKVLVNSCKDGQFATMAEVLESLAEPVVKVPRPYCNYRGRLSLGDYKKYADTAAYIDVERYFKTHQAKPPGASSFVNKTSVSNGEANGQDTEMTDAPDLSAVKSAITYRISDPSAPGGKKDINREELSKAYYYGSTAVPINASEENVTKLETVQSFEIIGFIHNDKYERYLNMGECNITVAQSVNDKARMALSSLIYALYELDSYAVARIVTKDGKDPQLLVMAPFIENDMEGLLDVPLPFAEDVRIHSFPPLDRVITTSGAIMKKHRNLPNDDLVKSMSDYVDSMDLSTFGKDEDGQPTEYMTIEETYAPGLHRINQAIRTRAVQPDKPVEDPPEILVKWSHPPPELAKNAASKLQKLVEVADVKKVADKVRGKRTRDQIKPLSGLDVNSLLNSQKPRAARKITMENSIPDFKQLLEATVSSSEILELVTQMAKIIYKMVADTPIGGSFDMVTANMRVLRSQMMDLEMPEIYNDFIQSFKQRLVAGELFENEFASNKRELWFAVKSKRLGLIDKEVSEHSDISKEEATQFYVLSTELPTRAK